MEVIIKSVRSPKWATDDQTAIDCFVTTNTLSEEVPFTASPNDQEEHGRRLFEDLIAGHFGEIAPFEKLPARSDGASEQRQPLVSPELPFPEIDEFLDEANRENASGSVRAIILVWSSMLDDLLKRLTNAGSVVPHDSFEGRICAAFKGDLIDQPQNEQLLAVKMLRNDAAHRWRLTFDDELWRTKALKHFRTLHKYDRVFVFHEDLEFLTRMVFGSAAGKLLIELAVILKKQNGNLGPPVKVHSKSRVGILPTKQP